MKRNAHVSDDRLVEVCLELTVTAAEETHFAACAECAARRSRLADLLGEIADAATADADAAFPDDRLAQQQARILQRIDQDGRPARVIAFPAQAPAELRPLRGRPAARWIAGAAAAGVIVGLLAGHLAHDFPGSAGPARVPSLREATARPRTSTPIRPVNASLNDDELLGEIENAIDGPTLAVLRPLNDLTPP